MSSKNFIRKYDITQEDLLILQGSDFLCIDTEATGLDFRNNRLCLIQIYNGTHTFLIQYPHLDKYKSPHLKELFQNKKIIKIFHFARFDVTLIYKNLNIICENIACTRIMSKLARTYSERHGLKNVLEELLNIKVNKSEQSSYWGIEELTEKQKDYARNDVLHLKPLFDAISKILANEGRLDFALDFCQTIKMVAVCEMKGFNPCSLIDY